MKHEEFNPADPAFLISCQLDGPLSDADRARLQSAIEGSKELQSESEVLRAVDRLVKRWGEKQVELDWHTFAATVQARIDCGKFEPELAVVDRWLKRWGRPVTALDEKRFVRQVMTQAHRNRLVPRSIIRWGLPLAAAAAVAVGVLTSFWTTPSARTAVSMVEIGPLRPFAPLASDSVRMDVVSFRRDMVTESEALPAERSISLIAVGSSAFPEWSEAAPL